MLGAGSKRKAGGEGALAGQLEGGRLPRCLDPVDVLVQIENSGAWQLVLVNLLGPRVWHVHAPVCARACVYVCACACTRA